MEGNYIPLRDLRVYQIAREYSRESWTMYKRLDWQTKKVIGDQFITSVDSGGANIAEGYGRFHYADKNKFYYNARGSLFESQHWCELLQERTIVTEQELKKLMHLADQIELKLNHLITSQIQQKNL